MSEFKNVIKDIERMCGECYPNKCSTDECQLYKDDLCYPPLFARIHNIDSNKLEEKVKKWAEEHPEPVYPTWGEWLIEMGVAMRVPIGDPWPVEMPDGSMLEPAYEIVIDKNEPIPEYIIKNLQIKPKER